MPISLFLWRLLRLGVDVKRLKITVPTDVERLEIQGFADKRQLYESTLLLIRYSTGLFPHEIKKLTNDELTTLIERITVKIREADKKRWG